MAYEVEFEVVLEMAFEVEMEYEVEFGVEFELADGVQVSFVIAGADFEAVDLYIEEVRWGRRLEMEEWVWKGEKMVAGRLRLVEMLELLQRYTMSIIFASLYVRFTVYKFS